MMIHVTDEDIKKSKPGFSFSCAVATALKRITGLTWSVGIYGAIIVNDTIGFKFPPEVPKLIGDFDYYGTISPFSFEFDWSLPDPEINYK